MSVLTALMPFSRRRILFGDKPEWREALLQTPMPRRLRRRMAPLAGQDLSAWDLVVPLSLEDQWHIDEARRRGLRVRAPVVPAAARALCDDKLAFARRVMAAGLGARVPPVLDAPPGRDGPWPVIVKPRQGAWGQGQVVLHGPDGLDAVRHRLSDPGWFLQQAVPGMVEQATHLLLLDGQVRFQATAVYRMSGPFRIKGAAEPGTIVDWLFDLPALAQLLEVLGAVGLTDGVCAINHKAGPDGPLIFEVNPRFGGSLCGQIARFLPACLEALA